MRRKGLTPRGSYRERLDWAWICARIRGAGVPESDVDDVAQVVVIAMSRAEKSLVLRPGQTERDARRATLREIIRYQVADYKRDKARYDRSRRRLWWSTEATAPSAGELHLRKERQTALHAALEEIKKLAGAYEVAILHGLTEAPVGEAARAQGLPRSTAWSRLKRTQQVLRELLEELGIESEREPT